MFVKGTRQLHLTILPTEQSTTQLKLTKVWCWRCVLMWRSRLHWLPMSDKLKRLWLKLVLSLNLSPNQPQVTSHETFSFPFFWLSSGAVLFWECTNVSKGLILIKSPFKLSSWTNQHYKISILLKIPQRIGAKNTGAANAAVYSCSVPHASQAVRVLHH